MDRIVLLDEALINKIAAGEVIERPASVVKELIENSLDANATKIVIETKEGGKSYIKVSDNGIGMSVRDADLSWQRHATSKIKTKDDLFSIKTYGFRGEALASIAAVSELTIITKEKESNFGVKIFVKGGKKISQEEIGAEIGTIVEVKNLFFNVPARRKYLKSVETELGQIIDIVTRYALINDNVHFILYHNNKEILNSPVSKDMLNKIGFVYGLNVVKEMIKVDFNYEINKDNFIKINGYISLPSLTRSTKDEQSIFVNKRYIKRNKIISDAIEDAYKTYVMVNRYPIVVINIELPFEKTDVNVHPQKAEIRIEDEALLYSVVYDAIKQTLEQNKKIQEAKPKFKSLEKHFKDFVNKDLFDKHNVQIKETKIPLEKEVKSVLIEENNTKLINEDNKIKNSYSKTQETQELLIKESNETIVKHLPEMKILGVINKTFIIAEIKEGLLIIDQHAAAERILYETFTNELKLKSVKIQELLNPEIIQLSAKNFNNAISNKDFFEKLGFKIEEFSNNSILLRSIPVILGRQLSREIFIDFLTELSNVKDFKNELPSFEKFFHNKIAKMACRKAIKAGDEITLPQIKNYIQQLGERYLPYTCPHGRPIFIKFNIYDLEKLFKRIV